MKKIKIAQVITRMDWGGSPDIVRILCERLDPAGYDIKLIYGRTIHPSGKTENFLRIFRKNIFYIPSLKRDIDILNDIIAFFNLYCIFRRERFDIVHTHTAKAGVLGRLAASLAGGGRVAHSPHGHNFYGYFNAAASRMVIFLERLLACFTDRIAVLTDLEKADFMKFKVAKKEKIVVINSGLELDNYRDIHIDSPPGRPADRVKKQEELKIGKDNCVIAMIGRLEPIKGPGYFIEAADKIVKKFPEAKFLVVGEGSLRKTLEDRCVELDIREKFIFTGWREDIPEILAIVDILVLPSLNEAVGRIILEAAASGVPVVAARVGGVPEIVRDNETGILVHPKDPDSLARGIIGLLEDRDKRRRMGEIAKKWADDKFSAGAMVKRFSDLYISLNQARS